MKRFYFVFIVTLSVIIVNYNVKHFLEQCLYSVLKASEKIPAEIIVVDNNSTDDSMNYLKPKFEQVRFIQNTKNVGFAKACNQALAVATGKYVLFLNPDTIVPEDSFELCINFLQSRPDAGALGICMLDGSGTFLPESKRAFPSPVTSLFKLFGFSKLFPRSRLFARYYLGHLPESETNKVDVLSGAFMMIKKEVLEKTGGFDENFFMYGEDVDLSYRIQKANYNNYYFADTAIIHFKGESTRKNTLNYVRLFHKAMSQFVNKHYGGGNAGIFNLLIHAGIWIRASLTATGNIINRIGLPLVDAGLIIISFWLVKEGWNTFIKPDIRYEPSLLWMAFCGFSVFFLIAAYYAGLYDKWYRWSELVRSTLIAFFLVLAMYAMLPEEYRFSRGIIFFGALLALILISILRAILVKTRLIDNIKQKEEHFNTVVASTPDEFIEVMALLKEAGLQQKIAGRVSVSQNDSQSLGYYKELHKISKLIPVKEIIFCCGKLSYKEMISFLKDKPSRIKVKIHAFRSTSIVGSHSKNISGESVSQENWFNLSNPYNKRLKRLIDFSIAGISLLIFPLQILIQKNPLTFLRNCVAVLVGAKTWIGYAFPQNNLPKLRKGVLASNGYPISEKQKLPQESLQMMDYWYARDYDVLNDLKLLWKAYRHLGS